MRPDSFQRPTRYKYFTDCLTVCMRTNRTFFQFSTLHPKRSVVAQYMFLLQSPRVVVDADAAPSFKMSPQLLKLLSTFQTEVVTDCIILHRRHGTPSAPVCPKSIVGPTRLPKRSKPAARARTVQDVAAHTHDVAKVSDVLR